MLMRLYRERYRPLDMPRVRVRIGVRIRACGLGLQVAAPFNPPLQPYRNRCRVAGVTVAAPPVQPPEASIVATTATHATVSTWVMVRGGLGLGLEVYYRVRGRVRPGGGWG